MKEIELSQGFVALVDDGRFFYAFIGLVITIGLVALIWPALILLERRRKR